eukprot:gene8597-7844_t
MRVTWLVLLGSRSGADGEPVSAGGITYTKYPNKDTKVKAFACAETTMCGRLPCVPPHTGNQPPCNITAL